MAFALLLGLHTGTEDLLKEAFLRELVDDAVVDDLAEVETLEVGGDPRVGLLGKGGLDGTCHDVGNTLEDVALVVQVVDARHVSLGLLVERHVCLHRKRLVVVEALDRLGVRLDDRLCELRILGGRLASEEVDRGQEHRRVVGKVGEHREPGLFEPEIVRRRQQRRISSVALQRGSAAADVGAHRNPLHIARAEAECAEQGDGVVVRRVANLTHREPLALEIFGGQPFLGDEGKEPLVRGAPHQRERVRVARAGNHALLERVVHHHGLTAGQHRHAGGMHAELQVYVEAVLLVVACLLRDVEMPRGAATRRVVDGDLLKRLRVRPFDQAQGARASSRGGQAAASTAATIANRTRRARVVFIPSSSQAPSG